MKKMLRKLGIQVMEMIHWPILRQINSSSNSVLWKKRRNFGLKSRLIFWAEIIRLEMQFRPPDVLPQHLIIFSYNDTKKIQYFFNTTQHPSASYDLRLIDKHSFR